ncbi:ISKra4 family transposase, partial [Corallococcus sp. RDP092CA]
MVKVTLEVPEEVAALLKAMEAKLQAEAKAAREFEPVDPEGALRGIDMAAEALSLEGKRRLLQSYDADAPRLLIDSAPCVRVGR